jgi:rare lipoprotein A
MTQHTQTRDPGNGPGAPSSTRPHRDGGGRPTRPHRDGGGRHPRAFLPLPLLLLLILLAGCHHHERDTAQSPAYTAPPPTLARNTAPPPRPTTPHPHTPAAPPPPARPEDAEGKPVSTETGLASWYGPPYHNHAGADGSIYNENALTVAHRTLPMGTVVRVTNLATGESVLARVTDRGPFVPGRILDLSLAAAKSISVYRAGVAKVRVEAFAKPNADPEGKWCVQIGTFLTADDAIQLKNDLLRRYTTARVIEFAGPTGFWVRINPFPADHTAALRIADTIHIPDAEPYLVRLN